MMTRTRTAAAVLAAMALVPLTGGPAQAQLPGNSGRIAFIRAGDVYTASSNGTDIRRLTTTRATESSPKWTPDGGSIVFVRQGWIWRMPAAGGQARRLAQGSAPSISPDGRYIAYVAISPADEECSAYPYIRARAADAGPESWVVVDMNAGLHCSWGYYEASYGLSTEWSNDGQRILYGVNSDYSGLEPPTTDVEETPARGSNGDLHRVISWSRPPGTRAPRAPEVDYSPKDAETVVLATNAGDPNRTGRLWVSNRSGTSKRQASSDGDVRHPVYSPEGDQVLYSQHTPGQQPRLRRVGLKSTTPTTVLTNGSEPDWQRVR
jgi:Tol biopolymer transport system component